LLNLPKRLEEAASEAAGLGTGVELGSTNRRRRPAPHRRLRILLMYR